MTNHRNIVFPIEEEIGDDIWTRYVDGAIFMTCERFHPEFYRDTKRYDQKSNGCGITYDIGDHIFQDRLIWTNGPFKAGSNNEKGNFAKHGLRDKIKEIGKRALGDKIYNFHANEISTFNAFYCDAVT